MTHFKTDKNLLQLSDQNSQLAANTTLKRPRENDTEEPNSKRTKSPEESRLEDSFSILELLMKTKLAEYGNFSVRYQSDCWIIADFEFTTDTNFKQHVLEKLSYREDDQITLVLQKSRKSHQYPCAAATQIYRGRGIYLTGCDGHVTRVDFQNRSPFQHPINRFLWSELQPKYRLLYVPQATLALKLVVNGTTLDNFGLKIHVMPTSILSKKRGNYLEIYRGLNIKDDYMLWIDDYEKWRNCNQGIILMNKTFKNTFAPAQLADFTAFFWPEHLNNITVLHNSPCWFLFVVGPSKDTSKAYVLRKATCLKKCTATFDWKKGFRLSKCYTHMSFGLGYKLWLTRGENAVFVEPPKTDIEKYIKNTDLFTFKN